MAMNAPKVGLVCSEPLRETMAGIGIRYFEMAKHLAKAGLKIKLIHPGKTPPAIIARLPDVDFETYSEQALARWGADLDVIVAQGHLANIVAAGLPGTPKVFDFYDPWLIENLAYFESLGWDPFYNDLASWRLQFEAGDFFLCSSDTQRQFYLGFLTALGRVHPERVASDPDLLNLIDTVPFGISEDIPEHRPWLEPGRGGLRRILFGGLYDWYDPWTLLKALESLADRDWEVYFVTNPNLETTPQKLAAEVKGWAGEKGWLNERVHFLEWVPLERRYDLVRDVDVLVAPHAVSLETRLCMRTRYLDAIAVNCPVISSDGGTIAELLKRYKAGDVVECQDHAGLAVALERVLWQGVNHEEGMGQLRDTLSWRHALQPLVDFCRSPKLDRTKAQANHARQGRTALQRWISKLSGWWH